MTESAVLVWTEEQTEGRRDVFKFIDEGGWALTLFFNVLCRLLCNPIILERFSIVS